MSGFRDVVAAHHRDSDAALLATREPCIRIAYDEERNVPGRSFRIVRPDTLSMFTPRASWMLAVLLCPGDNTEAVARWTLEGDRDPDRVVFYLHASVEADKALASWYASDLRVYSVWTIKTWKDLHRHFGAAWNVRVFDDFRRQDPGTSGRDRGQG